MLEILSMFLLVVLALFAFGSGLCAVLGLAQFAMGGGPVFALAGGALAAVSLVAAFGLRRVLSRLSPGDRDDGPK